MSSSTKTLAVSFSLEGPDGSGKKTQTDRAVEWLQSEGLRVGRVSFPRYRETPSGQMIFELLKSSEADLYDFAHANPYLASRIYAQDRLESRDYLRELYEQNDVVIFDRYVESNLIHQGGKFKSDSEREFFAGWLLALEYGRFVLPVPNLTIYLDLPPEFSFARSKKRAEGNGETQDSVESNMEYVKNSYDAGRLYSQMFTWETIECVTSRDGSPYELTPEEVHGEVRGVVKLALPNLLPF